MALFQSALQQLVLPSILLFLFLGSILAIAVGAGLILRPQAVFRLFGLLNKWVSTREAFKPLDQSYNFERALRRQRRLLGAVFLAAAVYTVGVLIQKFDVAAMVSIFGRQFSPESVRFAATILKWILLVCNALAIVVGSGLILYPDGLEKIEVRMNRWYSPRAMSTDMDIMHMTLDKWAQAHPRGAGWIMIVLATFVVLNLGIIIFSRH